MPHAIFKQKLLFITLTFIIIVVFCSVGSTLAKIAKVARCILLFIIRKFPQTLLGASVFANFDCEAIGSAGTENKLK